jgi:hypothetical protein
LLCRSEKIMHAKYKEEVFLLCQMKLLINECESDLTNTTITH